MARTGGGRAVNSTGRGALAPWRPRAVAPRRRGVVATSILVISVTEWGELSQVLTTDLAAR